MKCRANNCESEATVVVYWPGQTTMQCAVHALAAANVAEAMGFKLATRIYTIEPTLDSRSDGEVEG
jgi:hypothetical protein